MIFICYILILITKSRSERCYHFCGLSNGYCKCDFIMSAYVCHIYYFDFMECIISSNIALCMKDYHILYYHRVAVLQVLTMWLSKGG